MTTLLSRDALRKLNPAVYEQAAEYIRLGESYYGHYSCHAIGKALGHDSQVIDDPHTRTYYQAYGAEFYTLRAQARLLHFWNSSSTTRQIQLTRYTALLNMAALVRVAKASRGVKKPKNKNQFLGG